MRLPRPLDDERLLIFTYVLKELRLVDVGERRCHKVLSTSSGAVFMRGQVAQLVSQDLPNRRSIGKEFNPAITNPVASCFENVSPARRTTPVGVSLPGICVHSLLLLDIHSLRIPDLSEMGPIAMVF